MKYEVGQIIPGFAGHQESVVFDFDDAGAKMLVFFARPTTEEISQFESGKEFQIKFVELKNVIMVMAKIGNLEWVDAPYSPHLSPNLTQFPITNNGQGLALTLILIDAVTGQVKKVRLLGLTENFSKKFIGTVIQNKEKPFNKSEYDMNISRIYMRYSTKDLTKLTNDRCRIN
mgnify:CR=1 FL=1